MDIKFKFRIPPLEFRHQMFILWALPQKKRLPNPDFWKMLAEPVGPLTLSFTEVEYRLRQVCEPEP